MATSTVRFLLGLLAANLFVCLVFPAARYRSLVVHHTATRIDNRESIGKEHRKRGWSGVAYHLVLSNGSTEVPPGHLEPTSRFLLWARSQGTKNIFHNFTAIHLCVVGDYDRTPFPDELKPALVHAVRSIQERFAIPDSRILLHRDCSTSACPGRHLDADRIRAWKDDPSLACPEPLRNQHLAVLGRPRTTLLAGLLGLDVFLLVVWGARRGFGRSDEDGVYR